jgi:20S proteasome subunit beta 6
VCIGGIRDDSVSKAIFFQFLTVRNQMYMALPFHLFVLKGHGWSYGYDAIGSHEKVRTVCSGTGQTLLQPVLDNQVEYRQMSDEASKEDLLLGPCVELVKDAFASAGERDIYTGDTVEIFKITMKGVEIEKFELRRD